VKGVAQRNFVSQVTELQQTLDAVSDSLDRAILEMTLEGMVPGQLARQRRRVQHLKGMTHGLYVETLAEMAKLSLK